MTSDTRASCLRTLCEFIVQENNMVSGTSDGATVSSVVAALGMFGDFLNMSTGERNLVAYQLMGQIGNLIDGAIDAVGDRDPRVVPHVRDQRWERAVLAQFVPSPPCSVCTRFCGRTRIT